MVALLNFLFPDGTGRIETPMPGLRARQLMMRRGQYHQAMLRTRFSEMFGLAYPIMSAPMAMHSDGTLAAAVSAAGGLGSFAGIHRAKGPEWIDAEVATIHANTERPFAIGFITPFLGFATAQFEAALAARPPAIMFSFANPESWIARAKAAGARTICQVQDYIGAEQAVSAGADVLVAQGTEAGGHTGTLSLLPLLAGLAARYPDVPVLAAGGLGDGRTLAAVLIAGADGASLGTAFLATHEAVQVHEIRKRLIVESDGTDTVFTRTYDILSGLPWPPGIGERVRRNTFTEHWSEREAELRQRRDDIAGPSEDNPFAGTPDPDTSQILYGQSAGFVPGIRPAAEVISTICEEAEQILRARPSALIN
jgi:nitronate monooxygenase